MKVSGFIPSAGLGTRMEDLTKDFPKPLLPVNGIPLIYYSLFNFYRFGINRIFINVHYKKEMILDLLKLYPYAELQFSEESFLLGTAGGIRTAVGNEIDQVLVILNPDSIFDFQLEDYPINYLNFRKQTGSRSLLFLKEKESSSVETGFEFKDVNYSSNRQLCSQIQRNSEGKYYYTGYSIIHNEILSEVHDNTVAELGQIWKTEELNGMVCGRIIFGQIYECGNKISYLETKNKQIFSGIENEWNQFLSKL